MKFKACELRALDPAPIHYIDKKGREERTTKGQLYFTFRQKLLNEGINAPSNCTDDKHVSFTAARQKCTHIPQRRPEFISVMTVLDDGKESLGHELSTGMLN